MRVLVTGAATGIGRATALELASRAHEVIATARDPRALDDLEVAEHCRLDVTDPAAIDELRRRLGYVDGLVNNAGLSIGGPIEHVGLEHVQAMFDTNVFGPIRLVQAFVPGMRERGSGVVVNVSSVAGHVASPLGGYYAATKHALEAISEALYIEVGHFGVRVVIVEPGYVAPGMKRHPASGQPADYDELAGQLGSLDAIVLGGPRPGPELVARAIADALEQAATPLRVRVGDDAELILSTRASLDDQAFEATLRQVVDLTW